MFQILRSFLPLALLAAPGIIGAVGEATPVRQQATQAAPAGIASRSATAAPALNASDEEIAGFFDDYISQAIARLELPGGAVVVVRNGRTILAKGYGYSDIASKRPVDVNRTLFRAASISKVVPWVLALQLVEEGRLDLDRDVNAYLDFEIPRPFGRPVTMRNLMTHSAGFPERFHGAFDQDLSSPLGEVLRNNVPEQVYAPGSTIAYSNYGAALAGYVVTRLRRQSWERVVTERFFRPLGMGNSTVAQPVPENMRGQLASTYDYGSSTPGEFRTTPLSPMGSLTASPRDMGLIVSALMNAGDGANGRLLTGASVRRMITLEKPLGPGLRDGLGLGLMVGEYRGIAYAGHAGNMTTVATDLQLLPDQGLGYYYVFNGQGVREGARGIRDGLLLAVIDRFLAPSPPSVRPASNASAADVEGTYLSTRRIHSGPLMFSGLFNTTQAVAQPDGSLVIASGGYSTRWLPTDRDRFVEEKTAIPLAVTRGPDGQVERLASARLYPVAQFVRAPLLTVVAPPLALFGFGTLFLALLTKPFAWWINRRRRRTAGASERSSLQTDTVRADEVRRWARKAYWLLMATIFAWIAFAVALAVDFTILFSLPGIVRILLGLLTMSSAVFAAILLADGILSWRDARRGVVGRLAATVLAAGAAATAALFYLLDVVNFSANW